MKELISIIVPVYNVEQYIHKCVESILAQTYDNIEIILVDDGSTDRCPAICDEYAKQDNRIVVYHKQNGGLSSARNYGIERSSGKYIGFIDSDDYIAPDMYELLMSLILEYNADISMCRNIDVYDGKISGVDKNTESYVVGSEEAIKLVLQAEIASVSAVNKLYKTSIFESVRYPVGKTLEDAFVIVELLDQCNRIVITTEQKYYYNHRVGSITTNRFNNKNLDAIEAYEKNYSIIEQKYPSLINVAKMRMCWAYFYVLDKLIFDTSPRNRVLKREIIGNIKRNYFFVMQCKQFTKARKLSASLLMISENAYRWCVNLQSRRYRVKS